MVVRRPHGQVSGARALFLVLALALALALPAVGRGRGLRAQVAAPQVGDARAVRAARPISIEAAILRASESSEAVRIARSGITRARSTRLTARSLYLPTVSGSGGYSRALATAVAPGFGLGSAPAAGAAAPGPVCAPAIPAGATDAQRAAALAQAGSCPPVASLLGLDLSGSGIGATNTYIAGLSGSYPLLAPGRRDRRDAADAERRSADVGFTAQRAQVIVDVTTAYYAAALADQLVTIAEASLAQSERVLAQTRAAGVVGETSGYEVLRAEVARDNQIPAVLSRRADREIAYLQLTQLLDLDADVALQLTTPLDAPVGASAGGPTAAAPHALPPGVASAARALGFRMPAGVMPAGVADATTPDTAAAARAAVREQEEAVRGQESALRATRAQRLPVVSVTGATQRLAYPTRFFPSANSVASNTTVGLSVSVPLYAGGTQRANELAAEAAVEQARAQRDRTRKAAVLDARRALLTLTRAEGAYAASVRAAAQAARAYEIAAARYRAGLAPQTEVNDARIAESQARSTQAQAARDVLVVRVRLALLKDLPLASTPATTVAATPAPSTTTSASATP